MPRRIKIPYYAKLNARLGLEERKEISDKKFDKIEAELAEKWDQE